MFLRSIKHKLLLATVVSSSAALLMVAAAFFLVEFFSFRAGMQADFSTLAQIVGDQSTAALTYNDQATAVENLKALASKKAGILAACLYTNNSVFAAYRVSGAGGLGCASRARDSGMEFHQQPS